MSQRVLPGEKLPAFRYDTPYSSQNRFTELLRRAAPLALIFMSNFGHPITRTYALRYAAGYGALRSGTMALVVRSYPDKLARSIGPDTLPYPLLCDAGGVLYDYLAIPQRSGLLATCTLEAMQILREAKKRGYRPAKDAPLPLPLTLILDADGTVLFAHYGATLTDVPRDCAAVQALFEELHLDADDRDVTIYATPDAPATVPGVREYGTPDLEQTRAFGLFDDPYED